MEQLLRTLLLSLSRSRTARRWAQRYGLRWGARRFVAGTTMDEALAVVQVLQQQGLRVILDPLGEYAQTSAEAAASAAECLRALAALRAAGVAADLSVKLTQLGLDLGRDLCLTHLYEVLAAARAAGVHVTLDMEDSSRCQAILDVFDEVRQAFDNVGTVLQAYLYRSLADAQRLGREAVHLRVVKGAYREPPAVAYPDKRAVDANYLRLLQQLLPGPGFTAIATHDERMITAAQRLIAEHQVAYDRFEFQMLYGIRSQLQVRLAAAGYPVRVYVPYGRDWYGYFMRRLAERPANVAFVLRGMWR
ncbi:MAG: proline dehydrogenase family protein [Alicyclobacillus sp.]|nr:proline dehydrogenase family protein [Alicyclobacillus sp.]